MGDRVRPLRKRGRGAGGGGIRGVVAAARREVLGRRVSQSGTTGDQARAVSVSLMCASNHVCLFCDYSPEDQGECSHVPASDQPTLSRSLLGWAHARPPLCTRKYRSVRDLTSARVQNTRVPNRHVSRRLRGDMRGGYTRARAGSPPIWGRTPGMRRGIPIVVPPTRSSVHPAVLLLSPYVRGTLPLERHQSKIAHAALSLRLSQMRLIS